jgi:hypothetical protein
LIIIQTNDIIKNRLKKQEFFRKKITCCVCIVLFSISLPAFLRAQDMGDVNSDGLIDIVDALLTAHYYVGLNPVDFDPGSGDTDCDGSIGIVDRYFNTPEFTDRLKIVNLPLCRFPGGSRSDKHHWNGEYPPYAVEQG